MARLSSLFALCILSTAIAIAEGAVSEQPQTTGIQSSSNSVNSVPNSNGTVPSSAGGMASQTPSAPNQALPGETNPANPAAEGRSNGRAVTPERSKSGPPGTAAGNAPSNDRNSVGGENGNPTRPQTVETLARPRLTNTMPWLWSGMGIVAALILIGILMRRSREGAIERRDRTVITIQNPERSRHDDQIRRAG